MSVDRPGPGADDPGEAAQEPPPPDQSPPPDRPGVEGAPSRADSRNGAAAANDGRPAEKQDEEKPDSAPASQETAGGLDIAGDLPTGEELVKMENDKQSRAERARRKVYESGDEVLDDVGKVVNRVDQVFKRPPTGHPETRTGPEAVPAPHDGINATDMTTAVIAAGVVIGELYRRGREKLKQEKGV